MDKIKAFLLKWGWLVGLIFAGLFVLKMLFPTVQTKTVEKLVTDTVWQKTMEQKVDLLTTQFATQMATMNKQLSVYKQIAEDLKVVKTETDLYDPNTGKLVKKILDTVTESKTQASSTTTATTGATNIASTGSTSSSTATGTVTDAGHQHTTDSTVTTKNPQPILTLIGGLGLGTFNTFLPTTADLSVYINIFGIKALVMEDYNFTAGPAFKDRFTTHLGIPVLEIK